MQKLRGEGDTLEAHLNLHFLHFYGGMFMNLFGNFCLSLATYLSGFVNALAMSE